MKQLNTNDIARRIARLEKLSRDLADEADVFSDGDDPLTREERQAYINDLLTASGGLATARSVLANVHQRLYREEVYTG
jgi:hypothetical protein